MGQVNIHINPLSTRRVLKQIGLAIDEIKLVRSINSLNQQVDMSNAAHLESGRKRYLVSELRFLNKRLQSVRERAEAD